MADEHAIARKVSAAVGVLDFNLGTFAYFMARSGEQVTARFFGICIAFLNEIATSDEDTHSLNGEARAKVAKRMIDAMHE